jgi:hypothetical protein
MPSPRCSDEWNEDDDDGDVVDLYDAISQIEWREELAGDFNYEEDEPDDNYEAD